MNKAFEYINNMNNGYTKFLVYNILELLPEFNRVDIVVRYVEKGYRINYISGGGMSKRFILYIEKDIYHRKEEHEKSFEVKGVNNYLKSLNMYNDISIFVISILHELGHFAHILNNDFSIVNNIQDALNDFSIEIATQLSALNSKYDDLDDDDYNNTISQIGHSSGQLELLADRYALTNFYYVYTTLQQKGLI